MKEKKRRPLYSFKTEDKLRRLIRERLLPPPPPGRPLQTDSWEGWPDQPEWDQYRELEWEIALCLYGEEEDPEEEDIVEEITKEVRDHLCRMFKGYTSELGPEKRRYVAQELDRRFPLPAPLNPERDRRRAATSTRRLKDFLCKNDVPPGEADELIAKALGKTAGTLRRRTLQRAK
jgi:hypothetical protein